jgi:hypothetical protein
MVGVIKAQRFERLGEAVNDVSMVGTRLASAHKTP